MTTNSSNPQPNNINNIQVAQSDMRKGYANGAVGMLVSGLVWLTAALVVLQFSDTQAIWALLIGGMFIHPLSMLLCKLLSVPDAHTKGNLLAQLAMEGTVWMLLCMPLAYGLSLQHTEWFFHGMLLIIGGRYLTFASLYGMKLYWILGATLAVAAFVLFSLRVTSFGSALTGGLIEIGFGVYVYLSFRKT